MSLAFENVEKALHDADSHQPSVGIRIATSATPFEWFFVITGGLVVFLPFILFVGERELNAETLIHWYFWLSVLISSPHVYATYIRLQRKISEGNAHFLWGVPAYLAIVGLLTAIHSAGYFVITITLVNVWQSFHYLRQTYGVGCLYGGQKNFDSSDRTKRWWAYHLVFPYLIFGRWDTLYDAWGGETYELMPVKFDALFMSLLFLFACFGFVVQIASEITLIRKNAKEYNPTGLICFLICIGVHYYGFMVLSHFQRGFEAVTFFHAMQYLALVWVLERSQRKKSGNQWIAAVPNLLGFFLFWLVLFALGFGWEQYVTTGLSHFWVIASTILLSSISVHHYVVDSIIWRRAAGR
jgi:hypothetical protein